MAKRSPSHPNVSLSEALERAREFFCAWGENDAGLEESLTQWGYTSRSDAGRKLVASMTSYGLMDKTGSSRSSQRLRINERALANLFDTRADVDERSDTIVQMALKPDIHRRVWERWGYDLPEGEKFDRYLAEELGFNPRAIGRFVRCYVDTIELAKEHGLVPRQNYKKVVLEFEDDELIDSVSQGYLFDEKDDTEIDFEEAEESQDAQLQSCLVVNEDTDFELNMEEDEALLPPPREPVDDDHVEFDLSSVEDDATEAENFSRMSRALEIRPLASDRKMRELGRYSLRDGCKVAIYAEGEIDRETIEDLFTHLLADSLLGKFDTKDVKS